MTEKEALAIAGAVWCVKSTKEKAIDPELALEFARILRQEVNKANRKLGAPKNYWEAPD